MKNLKQELIRIRRQIHMHPELGNREFETAKLIESTLKKAGVRTKRITKTGVMGILEGGIRNPHSKCIALRADIDALPISEQTGRPYRSRRPGVMHACGHDAHTAMLLGAAAGLAELKDKFSGTVKFIFQPDEESVSGADRIIKAGVLRNPAVDMIFGMHVDPLMSTGVLGVKFDKAMAGGDRFEINIHGGGGHAALPHIGKDTVLCASEIIQSFQAIVSRAIDPVEPIVLSVSTVNGGTRFNVLADSVVMTGTVRLFDYKLRDKVRALMTKHISSIAGKYGLKFGFKYVRLAYPVINSRPAAELAVKSGRKITQVRIIENPQMGSEDFSEYLRRVKGCFLFIGAKCGESYPWHHPKFDIDENVLPIGAEVLKQIALDYLA